MSKLNINNLETPTRLDIRISRLDVGLTQKQCADLIHVSRASWSCWENGHRDMGLALWTLFLIRTGKLGPEPIQLTNQLTTSRQHPKFKTKPLVHDGYSSLQKFNFLAK